MDGIVYFIWMRGWINNYPHCVCGIYRYQFLKEKHHFSRWSPCLPIHFIHLSTSFFFQSRNSIYIFPHIFPSRGLCPWPTSCPSWEYHCTRHLIFNCFDSCSRISFKTSLVPSIIYILAIKIGWAVFEKIWFFDSSKFVYNFCKKFFFELILGVNSSCSGSHLPSQYGSNPSGGTPLFRMLILLRPF